MTREFCVRDGLDGLERCLCSSYTCLAMGINVVCCCSPPCNILGGLQEGGNPATHGGTVWCSFLDVKCVTGNREFYKQ